MRIWLFGWLCFSTVTQLPIVDPWIFVLICVPYSFTIVMGIRLATTDMAAAIYELLDRSRHLYVDFPEEQLSDLLLNRTAVVGEDDAGKLWGFLFVEREVRPSTMPAAAPNRLYLRSIALARKRSPLADIDQLLRAALELPALGNVDKIAPDQLIFFSRDTWPVKPLMACGFALIETVENFELSRVTRRWGKAQEEHSSLAEGAGVLLRAATPSDFEEIARLDALAFNPHWHFGIAQIDNLASHHRVYVAVAKQGLSAQMESGAEAETIVGYTALSQTMRDLSGWRASRTMHLARIATHPNVQGMGIGRYLLLDVLKHAHDNRTDAIMLNTQAHNVRSQTLYKRYGFRRIGNSFKVLVKDLD